MQFTHPCDENLVSFFICTHAKGRIFLAKTLKCLPEFISIATTRRINGDGKHRLGHVDVFERTRLGRFGVRVTTCTINSHHGNDVASRSGINFFTLVSMHAQNPREPVLATRSLVVIHLAFVNRTLIDTCERQLTKWIVNNFKCHTNR